MSSGMIAGYLLRKFRKLHAALEKPVGYVIYLLLFLLGLSVGQNEVIVRSFHLIGLKALFITVASVIGSLVLTAFVYKFFFKTEQSGVSAGLREDEA